MKPALTLTAAIAAMSLSAGTAQAQTTPTPPASTPAPTAGRITGVGGVFFKSRNPKALMAWYRDVLGIAVETWGGAVMRYDAPGHPPAVTVAAFRQGSGMMAPSPREFMLNFAVDNLDAFLARIAARGVIVLKRDDSDPYGRFAWILDPDGTKIELYEPKPDHPAE